MNANALCVCKTTPRWLLDGIAICRCKHLIWRKAPAQVPSFAPTFNLASNNVANMGWIASIDAATRTRLVREAKQQLGVYDPLPYEDVRDAAEAARLAGEDRMAWDIELEQWVAGLEER